MDGKEYIYKERALTRLPEIIHRIEDFYLKKFQKMGSFSKEDLEVIKGKKKDIVMITSKL